MARETAAQLLAVAGQAAGADRPGAQRPTHPGLGARALRWAAETPLVHRRHRQIPACGGTRRRVAVRPTGEVPWVLAILPPVHSHTQPCCGPPRTLDARLAAAHPTLVAAANPCHTPLQALLRDAARRSGT